jgi:hypothetical protein
MRLRTGRFMICGTVHDRECQMPRAALLVIVASLAVAAPALPASSRHSGSSPLDGRWKWTWTHDELVRNSPSDIINIRTLAGSETIVFANGRWKANNSTTGRVDGGTFTINGDIVTFTHTIGPPGVRPATMHYSIYRDRLTWKMVPGRYGWSVLTITPWTRVR